MYDILVKFLGLLVEIVIYFGYEYIVDNVVFVMIIESGNEVFQNCVEVVKQVCVVNNFIVLLLLFDELVINFFLCSISFEV